MLHHFEHMTGTAQLHHEVGVGGSRSVVRLCGRSVSHMIAAFAGRRLTMINNVGPSPLRGERLALRPGDNVEIYRKEPRADLSSMALLCEKANIITTLLLTAHRRQQ